MRPAPTSGFECVGSRCRLVQKAFAGLERDREAFLEGFDRVVAIGTPACNILPTVSYSVLPLIKQGLPLEGIVMPARIKDTQAVKAQIDR